MNENKPCDCADCRAAAEGLSPEQIAERRREWEKKCLTENGYYVHAVAGDDSTATGFNFHTHGLSETANHPDLQITVPMPPTMAHKIISTVADRVRTGEKLADGQLLNEVIKNFPVKLYAAKEGGRDVFRIILPDPEGKLEQDEMNDQYKTQYKEPRPAPKWVAHKH